MFRQFVLLLLASILLQVVVVAEQDEKKEERELLEFSKENSVPVSELSRLNDVHEFGFIGDLIIGQRGPGETVFLRTLEINNPTDEVYSKGIALRVDNGIIHYLSVLNEQGSYAVICEDPYSLGTSQSSFRIRTSPNTRSVVTIIVAAH